MSYQAIGTLALGGLSGAARLPSTARRQPIRATAAHTCSNSVQLCRPRSRHWQPAARRPRTPCSVQARKSQVAQGSSSKIGCKPNPLRCERVISFASRRQGNRLIIAATLAEAETAPAALEELLNGDLPSLPDLQLGQLDNGLRYVILPNKVPEDRFEAHLEVHAGSVDEGSHEQGIAHLVEHVTFLGSQKREGLLGTGARSNAYTDFHHTVFHVHAPLRNANTQQPMLEQVLEALTEIAFEPELLPSRMEKERRAVVAEAQMMNSIEYRVDCQLLTYLHAENALGSRFPIGKTEQVMQWSPEVLNSFWKRWYFPANATLYVVGNLGGSVEDTRQLIERTFGRVPPGVHPTHDSGLHGNGNGISTVASSGAMKMRHEIRPPVQHIFGCGPVPEGGTLGVSVFRHRLLQHFMLTMFCKLPVQPMTRMRNLRHAFMVRVLLSVVQFRVNARYVDGKPPFIGIDLDHSDSGREGCAVSTLTVTSEPSDWRGATQVAVQEMRRLQKFGVTPGELERYKTALLRDSEQLAEQSGAVPSVDTLDFVMESLALGNTVMDQREGYESMQLIAESITIEEVNLIARSLLSYISHYGSEEEAAAEAAANPEEWMEWGASHATSIVACVPAYMDASGHSTGDGRPMQRGASLTTSEHVDLGAMPAAETLEDDDDPADIPEGAVRFELSPEEVAEAIAEASGEIAPAEDIPVPEALLPDEDLEVLIVQQQPAYVALDGNPDGPSTSGVDSDTGVLQRRLSNGIRINFKKTDNEPRGAILRIVAAGGRSCEGSGPGGPGSVGIGTRTLSESGTVGTWRRAQVELFCISKLINCVLESDEEFICMDFHFATGEGGLRSVLELVHLFLMQPRWEESAMERSKQMYLSHYRSLPKSLERATADRIMASMLGPDRRFRDANPEEIEALTLEGMREAVMSQLHAGNLEVSIVGDIEQEDLESMALRYLGTVAPRPDVELVLPQAFVVQQPPAEIRRQTWHLKDSDERACAYIAGPAPQRWGNFSDTVATMPAGQVQSPLIPSPFGPRTEIEAAQRIRQSHPLYASVCLQLLAEITNSRLFTTVRDALGLTYDVSFELSLFDRMPRGWFVVNVTSTPQKIHDAMAASLRVLRTVATQRITPRELLRAKGTIITRHETDIKDNTYWLGLMTHLQADTVPMKSIECLRDLKLMNEAVTIDDIYDAYSQFNLDDEHIFSCVGTSGKSAPPAPPAVLPPGLRSVPQVLAGSNGSAAVRPSPVGQGIPGAAAAAAESLKAVVASIAAAGAAAQAMQQLKQQKQQQDESK